LFPRSVPELPAHIEMSSFSLVPELRVDNKLYQTWQEAVEREIRSAHRPLDGVAKQAWSLPFHFSSSLAFDPIRDGQNQVVGAIIRRQQSVEGTISIVAQPLSDDVFKISVTVENHTPVPEPELNQPEKILMRTFASTHTILEAGKGEFLSLMDPPQAYVEASRPARTSALGRFSSAKKKEVRQPPCSPHL
jgi:hypothetical protein